MSFVKWRLSLVSLLIAATLTGCLVGEQDLGVRGSNTVLFSLSVPGVAVPRPSASRSLTEAQEQAVEDVDVLVFDTGGENAGKLHARRKATKVTGTTFEVEMPEGTYDLMVLANASAIVDAAELAPKGTTWDGATAAMTHAATGKWTAPTVPMFGYLKGRTIDGATSLTGDDAIDMHRMLARIDVQIAPEAAAKFSLEAVWLVNYNTAGQLAPILDDAHWDDDGSVTNRGKAVAIAPSVPAVPGAQKGFAGALLFDATDGLTASALTNAIYTFEAEGGSAATLSDNPCVVIGGSYDGGGTSWYRLDLIRRENGTDHYLDLLRNHRYLLKINSIGGAGYPDPQLAFDARSVNIEASVVDWEEGNLDEIIHEGQYSLAFSEREITLGREAYDATGTGNSVRIVTDWPGGWSVDPAAVTAAAPWLTLGGASSGTDDFITLITAANNTGAPRTAKIPVTAGRISTSITVTQTAEYVKQYAVTVEQTEGGTAVATPPGAVPEAEVRLQATPGDNYAFVRWEVPEGLDLSPSAASAAATFTMPAAPVSVRPVYEYRPLIELTPDQAALYPSGASTSQTFTVTSNIEWTAAVGEGFTMTRGTDYGKAGGSFDIASDGTYTATGARFATVTVAGTGSWAGVKRSFTVTQSGVKTFPVTITPTGGGTVVADYKEASEGTPVTLLARPDAGKIFAGWSIGGIASGTYDPTANPLLFNMPAGAVSVSAGWDEGSYWKVNIHPVTGGNAVPQPLAAASGIMAETPITVTATPEDDYLFTGWNVEGIAAGTYDPSGNPLSFAMPAANVEISPLFVKRSLTLDQSALAAFAAGDGSTASRTFNVVSNVAWSLDWTDKGNFSVIPTEGGPGTTTVTVRPAATNGTVNARAATITVTGAGVQPQTVSVSQSAAGARTEVSASSLAAFAADDAWASDRQFTVVSNVAWSLDWTDKDNFHVEPASGEANPGVAVTVKVWSKAHNLRGDATKTATIAVTGAGQAPQTVSVSQSAAAARTDVSTSSLEAFAAGDVYPTASRSFTVTSNVPWNITAPSQFTVSPNSGAANPNVPVTVTVWPKTANPRGDVTRSETITVSSAAPKTVGVSQSAAPKVLTWVVDADPLWAFNEFGAEKARTFTVTSNVAWNVAFDGGGDYWAMDGTTSNDGSGVTSAAGNTFTFRVWPTQLWGSTTEHRTVAIHLRPELTPHVNHALLRQHYATGTITVRYVDNSPSFYFDYATPPPQSFPVGTPLSSLKIPQIAVAAAHNGTYFDKGNGDTGYRHGYMIISYPEVGKIGRVKWDLWSRDRETVTPGVYWREYYSPDTWTMWGDITIELYDWEQDWRQFLR